LLFTLCALAAPDEQAEQPASPPLLSANNASDLTALTGWPQLSLLGFGRKEKVFIYVRYACRLAKSYSSPKVIRRQSLP
jgi:hypothetical protein